MRIIYMGSPQYACYPLKALLDSNLHDVVAVVTPGAKAKGRTKLPQDPPLATYAKKLGLKVLQPAKVSSIAGCKEVSSLLPDVIITCAFGQILSSNFLDIPRYSVINIHPSDLPQYRGATPIQAAVLNGDKKTMVSILFTIKELDAGNIITTAPLKIPEDSLAPELLHDAFKRGGQLLLSALSKLQEPNFKGTPQNHHQASFCQKISKEDGKINWYNNNNDIYNRYRAFYQWPQVFTSFNHKRVIITKMSLINDEQLGNKKLAPKEFYLQNNNLLVGTNDKPLSIQKLIVEGKKETDAKSFWNGLGHKSPYFG